MLLLAALGLIPSGVQAQELRVNSGGWPVAVADSSGDQWQPDQFYDPSARGTSSGISGSQIAEMTDGPIYGTMRLGTRIVYLLPAEAGTYELEMKFLEPEYERAGRRVFDVLVNGVERIQALDLAAVAGKHTPVDRVIGSVSPVNGIVEVELSAVSGVWRNAAVVSAIALKPEGEPVSLSVSPSTASVQGGGHVQFAAQTTGLADKRVTWSVDLGEISTAGLYTAPDVAAAASATIRATSVASPSLFAIATVSISAVQPPPTTEEPTTESPTTESPTTEAPTVSNGFPIETKVVTNLATDSWQSVSFARSYDAPVAVCTPAYDASTPPLVTRMRNVTGAGLELKLERLDGKPDRLVRAAHCVVVEKGAYTASQNGVRLEAGTINSSLTDHSGSWLGESLNPAQSYANPVVLGQVMTSNDPRFSVFWAHSGGRQTPNSSAILIGKHVGQDPVVARVSETIGYIVLESGSGQIGDLAYEAMVGPAAVQGPEQGAPYSYGVSSNAGLTTAVLSMAGMMGGDGAWPVLYGEAPIVGGALDLMVDEDQLTDAERVHIQERVAYLALGQSASTPPPTTDPSSPSPTAISSLEAEDGRVTRGADGTEWRVLTSRGGYSGRGYLAVLPDAGVNRDTNFQASASRVDLDFNFPAGGRYRVWIRGWAPSLGSDSVHIGLNGVPIGPNSRVSSFPALTSWTWTSKLMDSPGFAEVNVPSAGVHTVNIWMREDGLLLDQVLVSADLDYLPSGAVEAPTTTEPPPATTPTESLTLSNTSTAFSATVGGPAPAGQTIEVAGTNGGALSWAAQTSASWVRLSSTTGTTPSTLQLSANPTGLAAGNHQASVQFSAAGSTATVQVLLSIQEPLQTSGGEFFVAPNGTPSGDGSISRPWDIGTALRHPAAVKPGNTIWLRGGVYGSESQPFESTLRGTAQQPIIVRQYPGERARVRGWIYVNGTYTWFWGFEIFSNTTDRSLSRNVSDGIDIYEATGIKLINLVIHNRRNGIGAWEQSSDVEIYGCLIYYNGSRGSTRGHYHGIYSQNKTGYKTISDNILFNSYGYGMQIYGSPSAHVQNYRIEGNVMFNAGTLWSPWNKHDNLLIGGAQGNPKNNIAVRGNYFYHTPSTNDGYSRVGLNWDDQSALRPNHPSMDVKVTDNYWIGGENGVEVWFWDSVEFKRNTVYTDNSTMIYMRTTPAQETSNIPNYDWNSNSYYGRDRFILNGNSLDFNSWKARTRLDSSSTKTAGRPTGVWAKVRPNKYEANRGHVVVYNWDGRSTAQVDLSTVLVPGAVYEIRDAQDFFGPPVATGVYQGGSVSVPLTGLTIEKPVGVASPAHTMPEFNVFVVKAQ